MKKILIIEDDTDINNMTADALKKAGYRCTQAFSGTEGLLYISHEPFDLVIMDLMLPGLAGEELLPRLKEQQKVPVIVISAKGQSGQQTESSGVRSRGLPDKTLCHPGTGGPGRPCRSAGLLRMPKKTRKPSPIKT